MKTFRPIIIVCYTGNIVQKYNKRLFSHYII